jgi:hypothetical protein
MQRHIGRPVVELTSTMKGLGVHLGLFVGQPC